VDSNLYLREGSSPTERGWEGRLGSAFAGVGRSLKAFGYIASRGRPVGGQGGERRPSWLEVELGQQPFFRPRLSLALAGH
jgi:hypothetical protein